jgi:DNA-binding MarR family transcriptional regulator
MHYLKQDIGYWISRYAAEVHQGFERKLAAYDITVPQWCILLALYSNCASSITELATYIVVDKATVSRTVERLVKKGLLERRTGADRRSEILELTSAGQELTPKLIACADANEAEFFGGLEPHERQDLQRLWRKLVGQLGYIEMEGWLK